MNLEVLLEATDRLAMEAFPEAVPSVAIMRCQDGRWSASLVLLAGDGTASLWPELPPVEWTPFRAVAALRMRLSDELDARPRVLEC